MRSLYSPAHQMGEWLRCIHDMVPLRSSAAKRRFQDEMSQLLTLSRAARLVGCRVVPCRTRSTGTRLSALTWPGSPCPVCPGVRSGKSANWGASGHRSAQQAASAAHSSSPGACHHGSGSSFIWPEICLTKAWRHKQCRVCRVGNAHPAFILKTALAADERRLTQMNHAVYAPRPFTLLVGWRIRAAH